MTVHKRKKELEAKGEIETTERVKTKRGTYPSRQVVKQFTIEKPSKTETAPDLTPAKFICPECQDVFTEQVWHCPVCVHHWGLEDDDHTRHITPT